LASFFTGFFSAFLGSAFFGSASLGEAQTRRRHYEHHGKQDCENLLHYVVTSFRSVLP